MIEFRGVGLFYGDRTVLRDLTFKAEYWEKIAILGGSGTGKTSVLKLMLGLIRPDRGTILIDGKDITTMPEAALLEVRRNFTIVFQEGALFDSLSVKENVAFYLREYGKLKEAEIEARVRELLRRVGMEDAIYLMPDELSGGMQRRAAIARALAACTPRMMLYDEPTTGLDPVIGASICGLITDLAAGQPPTRAGLVIVTHKIGDAAKVAERFLFLRQKIVFDGDLRALGSADDPGIRNFVAEFFAAPPLRVTGEP